MKDIKKIKENLVYDLREFVQSRKFSDVVFGLSGGMDSALVLALAAEALGPQHVHTFTPNFIPKKTGKITNKQKKK